MCWSSEMEKKREAEQRAREAQERELRRREKAEEKERRRREYDALRAARQEMETQTKKESSEIPSKLIVDSIERDPPRSRCILYSVTVFIYILAQHRRNRWKRMSKNLIIKVYLPPAPPCF